MEIPIITSNIPGCNNVVRNNYNGFLSDVNDVQGLISSINLFLNLDFNERKLFGSRGREIVLNSFSESVINKKYLEIIFN
jgi:glycosyltransferase involved in cell wall biosynthesis